MARTKAAAPNKKEDRSLQAWADVIMKKKSRRTAPMKKTKTINPRYRNLGGFMIDPPDNCPKRVTSEDGAWWTDMGLCHHCKNKCERYLVYKKMTPEERKEDSVVRGIIQPKPWKVEE